jgi:hypothetical protein
MNIQFLDSSNALWLDSLHHLTHDFYHFPQYFMVEAKRLNAVPEAVLIQEDDKAFFLPYLIRSCSNLFDEDLNTSDVFDIVSPNGYAGILLSESAACDSNFIHRAMDLLIERFSDRNIPSAFLRLHPLLNDRFADLYHADTCKLHSETISIDLTLSETELWSQTRPEHRTKINRCQRAGFTTQHVSFEQNGNDFIEIYTETMNRVGASNSFYFTRDYFLQLAEALGQTLHLCIVKSDHSTICAGLFTECSGIVQYHLGGTKTAFLKQSPSVLMFHSMRHWTKARGNHTLHLGGGIGGAQDSLHHFKAGFSKRKHPLPILRLIPRPVLYQKLVRLRAKSLNCSTDQFQHSNFFPIYRSVA